MKYDIRQIFTDMERDLISSMKRNLASHESEERKAGFKWPQWQRQKLADARKLRKENERIARRYARASDAEIERTLGGAFRRGVRNVADAVRKLFGFRRHGEKAEPDLEVADEPDFFRTDKHRIDALTEATKGELRNARSAMLRQADDVYRQTVFKAQVHYAVGATSLNEAIDKATKDFLDRGFDSITYAGGRRVNIASYAEMALRTATQRAVFTGEGAKRQELGIRTVLISAHSNCSELCLPWQGRVFIDDVYSGGTVKDGPYPLLSTAMAAGLFHPNCWHNMTTFIAGSSRMPEPVDEKQAAASYEAEQQQRYMERQIRKYKRREAGSTDPGNQAKASAKVQEWQARVRGHLQQHPELRRDYSREKVRS